MAPRNSHGKSYRRGTSLAKALRQFDTEEKAEAWFVAQRWPHGVTCPLCESKRISVIANRKPQPYRCRDCRRHFSVKTDTLLHSSNIPLTKWAIAFFLFNTSLQGVSSMKLHRDLGLSQRTAWYMGQRIRRMWNPEADRFAGPAEAASAFTATSEGTWQISTTSQAGPDIVGSAARAEEIHSATNQVNPVVVTQTEQAAQADASTPQESLQVTANLDPTAYTHVSTAAGQGDLATNQVNPVVVTQTEQAAQADASTPQEPLQMSADLDAKAYAAEAQSGQRLNRGDTPFKKNTFLRKNFFREAYQENKA